jgi:hydrogenase nickel incorporation protein HypB
MCTVCGCGTASLVDAPAGDAHAAAVAGRAHAHPHDHDHGRNHSHDHTHDHDHGHGGDHHHAPAGAAIAFGAGLAGVSVPGLSQERTISIERDILAKNNAFADANRRRIRAAGVFALNLVSSPGSGKTSLLVRTIAELKDRWPMAVIEGDQQTSNDAERIRRTGAQAVQINTGKGCHLDAHMVGHALEQLSRRAGCCSSRTLATSFAPPPSTSAKPARSSSCP